MYNNGDELNESRHKDKGGNKDKKSSRSKLGESGTKEQSEPPGIVRVNLEKIKDGEKTDMILPIEGFHSGKLHLQLTFLPLPVSPVSTRPKKMDPLTILTDRETYYPGSTIKGYLFMNPTRKTKIKEAVINGELVLRYYFR